MEEGIMVVSDPCGGGGNKTKKRKTMKGDFLGGAPTKMLADVTNLQQEHLKPLNQHAKKQSATPAVDDRTDQLLKENAMLMKLLASRNAIIESGKADLQKLQSNFQKLRMQNMELARANSQMLAELNSSRQRLRELQLELGCKNGILKAVNLKSKEEEQRATLKFEITATESQQQSGQTFQVDGRGDNLCNAKRRRMSISQSSEPAVIKQVNTKEKVDNQRHCLRKQSMGLNCDKPGPTEDIYEANETKSSVSHLQENLVKEKGLISSRATVQEETREDTESSRPSTIGQVHAKENIDKRQSLRRQSARFKLEVPEPTEETRKDSQSSGLSTTEQVHTNENVNERIIRRQSASFKPEDSIQTEDLFEIDDPKFDVFLLHDNVVNRSSPTKSSVTSGQQNKENNSLKSIPHEVRRSSVGRPLRQAATKVQTYKEIPLNVKMRRAE